MLTYSQIGIIHSLTTSTDPLRGRCACCCSLVSSALSLIEIVRSTTICVKNSLSCNILYVLPPYTSTLWTAFLGVSSSVLPEHRMFRDETLFAPWKLRIDSTIRLTTRTPCYSSPSTHRHDRLILPAFLISLDVLHGLFLPSMCPMFASFPSNPSIFFCNPIYQST